MIKTKVEENLDLIKSQDRICFKCGGVNDGDTFTVTVKGKDLSPRKIRVDNRGMHLACAEAWIERARLSPKTLREIPEMLEALQSYEEAVQRCAQKLEDMREEIKKKDHYLTSVIGHYYDQQVDGLKAGVRPAPMDKELLGIWKSWVTRTKRDVNYAWYASLRPPASKDTESDESDSESPHSNMVDALPTELAIKTLQTLVNKRRATLLEAENRLKHLYERQSALKIRKIVPFPGRK